MHSKPMLLSLRTNYLSFMPLLTGLAGYLEERGMRTIVCITSFAADRGGGAADETTGARRAGWSSSSSALEA